MQVLLIARTFPPAVDGGVGYHAYNLASALVDRGDDVHVLTGESDAHSHDDSPPPLPDVEISTLSYRQTVAPRVWFARKAAQWLQSFDRLDAFDLVHAHEYLDFDDVPFDGSTIQNIHFNLTEKPAYLSDPAVPAPFDGLAFTVANATIWNAERRLEPRAVRTEDAAIANSHLTKQLCQDRHDLAGEDIHVVYNGVDVDRFTPAPEPAEREELLYVGGNQKRKGVEELLDAIRCLEPSTDLAVTVAGSTDGLDTRELEATLPVDFVGRVSHEALQTLYRRAAGLVHPALYEPFGNVVLESLACGTPVVVSEPTRCGAAELIDEDTGVSVDPTDPIEVAEAMHAVATRPDRFDPASCRAVAEGHTWGHVAEATIGLIDQNG